MDEDADILSNETSLRDYFDVIRRRKWIVVITVLVVVGITLAYSLNQPRRYAASAYVQVPPPGGENSLEVLAAGSLNADQQRQVMQDEATFAQGSDVTTATRKRLGFRPVFEVEPVVSSSILRFTGISESPRDAARIANTAATSYLDQSLEDQKERLRQGIKDGRAAVARMTDQVRELPPSTPASEGVYRAAGALQTQVANAQTRLDLMTESGGQFRVFATEPDQPFEPKTERNVAIALVLSLVLGVGLAFFVDRLDDTVRSRRDVDLASDGLPLLGSIPSDGTVQAKDGSMLVARNEPGAPATEAYRMLRTSIELLNLSEPVRAISITSPNEAEGKSSTVANLGVVLAAADRRVAAVCCDFRKPRLHDYLGATNDVGLTSVLLGETTIDAALRPVDGVPGLVVLPAGPLPPNPSELLALQAVRDVITDLSRRYDYVLVDGPPVLPVSDAVQIAALVDGVIVVALAKHTRKRQLRRVLEILPQANAPVLGTVLRGIHQREGYAYGDEQSPSGGLLSRIFRRRSDTRRTSTPPTQPVGSANGASAPTNGRTPDSGSDVHSEAGTH